MLGDHHILVADRGIGLAIVVETSVQLIEVLAVEAFHHIEDNRQREFLVQGIHRELVRLGGCSLVEIR